MRSEKIPNGTVITVDLDSERVHDNRVDEEVIKNLGNTQTQEPALEEPPGAFAII